MNRLSFASLCSATALVGCSVFASVAFGQSSDTTAQPHVRLLRYALIGDRLGKFSQEGIAPGAYLMMLFTDGKAADVLQSVSLKAGGMSVLEVNMSSKPQIQVSESGGTLSMVARERTSEQTR